mgnify:CR=1 FL=1
MSTRTHRSAGGAILNEDAVRDIRLRAAQGQAPRNIALHYDMAAETVRRVIRRETWAWVQDEGKMEATLTQPTSPIEQAAITASQARLAALLDGNS